jgi:hypothetical protein
MTTNPSDAFVLVVGGGADGSHTYGPLSDPDQIETNSPELSREPFHFAPLTELPADWSRDPAALPLVLKRAALVDLISTAADALAGDSNDAEHDALYELHQTLRDLAGLEQSDPGEPGDDGDRERAVNSPRLDRETAHQAQLAAELNPGAFPAGLAPALARLIDRDQQSERRAVEANAIHPARAAAMSAHDLRHSVRELSEDQSVPDRVGLRLAANVLDQVAGALADHWHLTRPQVEGSGGE